MTNKCKLVVIGNGMAGVRAVEEILKINPNDFDITIFGKEPHPNYNRILLSKVLQGDTTVDNITLNSWEWYKDNQITLYTDEPVVQINTERQYVVTSKDRTVPYDKLIIATGSLPFMLPLPGAKKEGVTAFRDIYDCEKMVSASKNYEKAVVIGGGLLGLEAARGLLNLGMKVDVVHIGDYLMDRQLDPLAAEMLRTELEKQGMNFLLQTNSVEITGHKRAKGIRFADGSWREADLIVMAVGVRPNTEIAAGTDIEVNRAIVVDDFMRTNLPNIYAVGECAEHRGFVYGLVAPLYEQGKALAAAICGQAHEGYHGSVLSTQLKVSGVDVFSTGEFMDSDDTQSLKWYDGIQNTYKKVVIRDGKVVGAVLFGDTSEGSKFLSMIKRKADYKELKKELAGPASDKDELIAAMADNDIVCACNGVSKGTIEAAVCEQELSTVDDVKACTKASSSCGGCRPVVADILEYIQRNGSASKEKQAICACTTADHDELIKTIQQYPDNTQDQIMVRLNWNTAEGCDTCRPAVQYYIGVHSETVIEEKTADGTCLATPRLYGGVTGANQLRDIADIVEKYAIPLVKLAPGPRMELHGIPENKAAAVRAELKEAGPAYGYKLRAVATSAGAPYEKNAMQDSLYLGPQLEKELEEERFPAEITIGVSAGIDDQAKAKREEVSLLGAPSGWELYGAGQRLYTALKANDAIAMVKSLLRFYQTTAFYSELFSEWMQRLGTGFIREEIVRRKMSVNETENAPEAKAVLSKVNS